MPDYDNANRVRFRTLDWAEMCRRSEGKNWTAPQPAYEFTGRTFMDNPSGGPYTPKDWDTTPTTWDQWDRWE